MLLFFRRALSTLGTYVHICEYHNQVNPTCDRTYIIAVNKSTQYSECCPQFYHLTSSSTLSQQTMLQHEAFSTLAWMQDLTTAQTMRFTYKVLSSVVIPAGRRGRKIDAGQNSFTMRIGSQVRQLKLGKTNFCSCIEHVRSQSKFTEILRLQNY